MQASHYCQFLGLHGPLSEAHLAALPCVAWAAVLGCPSGLWMDVSSPAVCGAADCGWKCGGGGGHRGDGWYVKTDSLGNSLPCAAYSQRLCRSCAAVSRRSGRSWRRDSRVSLASWSRLSHFLLLSKGLCMIAPACKGTPSAEAYIWQYHLPPCCHKLPIASILALKHSGLYKRLYKHTTCFSA